MTTGALVLLLIIIGVWESKGTPVADFGMMKIGDFPPTVLTPVELGTTEGRFNMLFPRVTPVPPGPVGIGIIILPELVFNTKYF